MRTRLFQRSLMAPFFIALLLATQQLPAEESEQAALLEGKALIQKLPSQQKDGSGSGYELIYVVDAPLEVYWKFKTDFENDYIVSNKFIISHRLVSQHGNVVVTEDIFSEDLYTHKPKAKFLWQTTLFLPQYRLDFVLLNPAECGQKFHYGSIRLETFGVSSQKTKITQRAYFDFFGVSFWVNYPWYGGMKHFLRYTARWEQDTVLRLKPKYIQKSAQ